jgi:hypothetical protein
MPTKEIEISIKPDGSLSIDQIGFEGKDCSGAIDALIKALGKEVKNVKKQEWYKDQRVRIHQKHQG